MLSGSENCARIPPAARLVEPPASSIPLEEADVDTGLREVKSDARSDDAASDDDDLGGRPDASSTAHEVLQEEPEVRRPLREAAHEVRVPIGAER